MADLYAYDTTSNRLSRLQVISSTVDPVTGEVYGVLLAQVDGAASNLALETGGNLAAAKADLDSIVTNTNKIPTSPATEGGHLATIDTSTAAAKTDLDTIVTNTNKIPASPATEGGHLATIDTSTAASKTDLDTIATNLNQLATSDSLTIAGIPTFIPGMSNGSTGAERLHSMSGLGDSLTFAALANAPWLYNGTNWDRQRNNIDNITILASASRTTTQTPSDITNYNWRGVVICVDTTVLPGSAVSNVVTINGKDPLSGKYQTLLTGAAIVGVSTNFYTIYPSITTSANIAVSTPLPRTFQVKITVGNSNACTYSVGAMFLL